MLSSLTLSPHYQLEKWHASYLFCKYSSIPNSFAKQVTPTCVKVFHIAQQIGAKTSITTGRTRLLMCMVAFAETWNIFKVLHFAPCCYCIRKWHSIKEIWQQDTQAIETVCGRETGRLQILVTTGGSVLLACFYHMASAKRGKMFIYRTASDYCLLI